MEVVVYVKKVKFCVFVLRFYSPVNPIGSCQARSVYLTTQFYWAGLVLLSGYNQYCAHSFARNLQLPFLNQPRTHIDGSENQQKKENDPRKTSW